jgi:hypothetical protein
MDLAFHNEYFRRYACTSWKPLKEDKAKLLNVQKVRSARVLGDLFSNRKDTRVSLDVAGVSERGYCSKGDPLNLLGVDALPRPTCNSIIHLTFFNNSSTTISRLSAAADWAMSNPSMASNNGNDTHATVAL